MKAGNFAMAWQPVMRPMPVLRPTARLGQAQPPVPFLESPELAAVVDATAAGMSAYLAYGLGKIGSSWSTFWWIVSAATGVKLLHDVSKF